MQTSYREILFEILTSIKYFNNKEKVVAEFEELNHMEAFGNTIEQLPYEVQEQIRLCNNDHFAIKKIIPGDLYSKELVKVSLESLHKFINELTPFITNEQKKKITGFVSSY